MNSSLLLANFLFHPIIVSFSLDKSIVLEEETFASNVGVEVGSRTSHAQK